MDAMLKILLLYLEYCLIPFLIKKTSEEAKNAHTPHWQPYGSSLPPKKYDVMILLAISSKPLFALFSKPIISF
jgi:hypothetical protein